jgi:transposase
MTTRIASPHQQLNEWRRLRAWALSEQGWSGRRIAQALGVTPGAVSQWLKRARTGGAQALIHRMPPGSAPRLTAEQRAQLPTLLSYGAEAYGFLGDVWTSQRVATVIQREFGVGYHRAHVSRLLRQMGWCVQKPIRRATQRDDAAIERWTTERWPALFAKPKASGVPSSG